jgi:site-specific DNA-cytosine methylase
VNFYNENDPKAAAWIRALMSDDLIPKGEVDERSIADVQPSDLRGFTQCHFFAGVSGWSLALRIAGWGEDRQCWTGSCPCQPFSQSGKGMGTKDERHLWPEFFRLIKACRPSIVFGEQVASKLGREWLGKVCFDLEHPFYENDTREILHLLQADEAFFRLPPIQGAMQGWIEAALQRLSAGIRKEVAEIVQGKIAKGSMDSITESEGIRKAIQGAVQGSLFD